MIGTARPENYRCILAICIFALLLAVAWPVVSAAQAPPSGPPGSGPPTGGPPTDPGGNPGPTPTSTPAPTPSDGNGAPNPPTSTPTEDPTLTDHELLKALAPNRIVFHSATPVQLCKVDDGLQVYFVSRKGKTRLGPWVPSFTELAAKYPHGEEASIYFGFNPFTGKPVKIDYLPSVHRIRVDTFYANREHDKNKQYIFHFGPEHDITYDAW